MNKRRPWLTIDEAADYLTTQLSEPFTPADIYHLALDGYLTLSLNLMSPVSVCKVTLGPRIVADHLYSASPARGNNPSKYWGETPTSYVTYECATMQDNVARIFQGVEDVLPKGLIRTELKKLHCESLGIPVSNLDHKFLPGCIFVRGEGETFQLQRRVHLDAEVEFRRQKAKEYGVPEEVIGPHIDQFEQKYRSLLEPYGSLIFFLPSTHLPGNAFFVARKSALNDFIAREKVIESSSREEELSPRTSNMLLDLLYEVLADRFGQDVADNPRKHFDDAKGVVRVMLDLRGAHVPSGQAIERQLKKRFNPRSKK